MSAGLVYPAQIESEAQLEDVLSLPGAADVEAARTLQGDLLVLGAAGKMGPSLLALARRADDAAGVRRRIFAVARFSDVRLMEQFRAMGVEPIRADLLRSEELAALPDAPNVIYMAARKFGTAEDNSATWAMNAYLPGRVAERFSQSRIVSFSTGNVYAFTAAGSGGPTEETALAPVGEYGLSALARERVFTHFSRQNGTPMAILRLNYAIDLRYGVLVDIGRKVLHGEPVDVSMGTVNVLWQRDANAVCLRALAHCSSPPWVLNLTGPEMLSVRWIAERFGEHLGKAPVIHGEEQPLALLNNASRCQDLFGYPTVGPRQLIRWVAHWLQSGGVLWDKPTKFQVRDGKF